MLAKEDWVHEVGIVTVLPYCVIDWRTTQIRIRNRVDVNVVMANVVGVLVGLNGLIYP